MKCNYRRCDNEIPEGKRKDAKFCCVSHKKMEQTYKKRREALLEKYKEEEMKNIELIKYLKNITNN
jgi:ABC-type sulfate transport system substrate-binding protein